MSVPHKLSSPVARLICFVVLRVQLAVQGFVFYVCIVSFVCLWVRRVSACMWLAAAGLQSWSLRGSPGLSVLSCFVCSLKFQLESIRTYFCFSFEFECTSANYGRCASARGSASSNTKTVLRCAVCNDVWSSESSQEIIGNSPWPPCR